MSARLEEVVVGLSGGVALNNLYMASLWRFKAAFVAVGPEVLDQHGIAS